MLMMSLRTLTLCTGKFLTIGADPPVVVQITFADATPFSFPLPLMLMLQFVAPLCPGSRAPTCAAAKNSQAN